MITTRFAPSPTGFLHIGGLRTALFSYLFARANGGRFILRIEDTDAARNSEAATAAILEAFEWTGLKIDGEITYQSKRGDIYARYIEQLLREGKAYYCYCSPEELEAMRAEQSARKERPKYDGRWRDSTATPPAGVQPVVRIKAPCEGKICINDGVKGEVEFECADILDDFIIARADGSPTYNFVVVVDDALMGVTDVIRGDDHLSNTPKQIVLYEALGFALPRFYHLAMINGEDGAKLSKRHGATDVMDYQRAGVLPQALLNFLLRLGFSHGDQEVFSMEEAERLFNFAHVSKSASCFNAQKLEWLNAHYIKTLPFGEINAQCARLGFDFTRAVAAAGGEGAAGGAAELRAARLCDMLRERAKNLLDLISAAKAILERPAGYDAAGVAKFCSEEARGLLADFASELEAYIKGGARDGAAEQTDGKPAAASTDGVSVEATAASADAAGENFAEGLASAFLEARGAKLKTLAQPLRLALVGSTVSPSIYEVMDFLGAAECAKRVAAFNEYLKSI